MFQGTKTIRELNYRPFPFDPRGIDQLLLTHAHIDHSGLVPKLTKHGFKGGIHATEPTLDLLKFMLPDSGHIQEFEVERLNERNRRRGRPQVEPIYTRADAEACLRQGREVPYGEWVEPGPGLRARWWNAGHILGSASIEVEVADAGQPVRILFSGDIGPDEKAFHADPDGPAGVDHLLVESTYGDRDREDTTLAQRLARLETEVRDAMAAGGNLLIPAFAVERTQEVLDGLAQLMSSGRVPRATIYIDSPLARDVTRVFAEHGDRLFQGADIRFTETVAESKAINAVRSGAIVMSASGMCEAGRIRHHLKNNLWRPEATVLFVGYQAPGSLGHLILRGERLVRIEGDEIAVKARIRSIDSFSAHADQKELVAWVAKRLPVHGRIFLVHGEPPAMTVFAEHLATLGCDPSRIVMPALDERFELHAVTAEARASTPRLAPAEAEAHEDWHNAHSRLLLDLAERLRQAPDDAARQELLRRVRGAMAA
jgi:metallo-beta-lactamase family protein